MSEKPAGPVDLFGDPLAPFRDPRGRKPHRRIPEIAEKVGVLKATGSTDGQIADRIGLSLPTLRKYYFAELDGGGDRARQVLIERMWSKALEGNVSAAKFIRDELAKGVAVDAAYNAAPVAGRLGKKEQRQAAAEQVGGIFAPGAPPARLAH